MKTVGAKVSNKEYDELYNYCESHNTNINRLLRKKIEEVPLEIEKNHLTSKEEEERIYSALRGLYVVVRKNFDGDNIFFEMQTEMSLEMLDRMEIKRRNKLITGLLFGFWQAMGILPEMLKMIERTCKDNS